MPKKLLDNLLRQRNTLKLFRKARSHKIKVSTVCKRLKISRSYFYILSKKILSLADKGERVDVLEKSKCRIVGNNLIGGKRIKPILDILFSRPQSSVANLFKQIYAKEPKLNVSYGLIQNFLIRSGLNTCTKRVRFVKWAKKLAKDQLLELMTALLRRRRKEEVLSPEDRLTAIRLADSGVPVAYICKAFNISRANYYKWHERYQQSSAGKEFQAMLNRTPSVKDYWRQTPQDKIDVILRVVYRHPEYSTHKIAQSLSFISNHGVQNVFRRLNLNTYYKRLSYSQAATAPVAISPLTGWFDRIKSVFATFVPQLAPAPPPQIKPLFKPFFRSFVVSSFISFLFLLWLQMLSAYTPVQQVGLSIATASLVIGFFFFLYSMKYYFSLALVLSYSRKPLAEGEGFTLTVSGQVGKSEPGINGNINNINGTNGNGKGLLGFLGKVFGVNGYSVGSGLNGNGKTAYGAAGLQPNLEHIKPGRYPYFSIQLPFYNEKKVAKRIINACMSMDYPKGEDGRPNYEVIVCDDSNDETVDIVMGIQKELGKVTQYIGKDKEVVLVVKPEGKPTLKVLHRPTRAGFKGGALRYALQNVDEKTEFISIFDADFVPYPDTLRQFVRYLKASGGWNEKQNFSPQGLVTMPYDTNQKMEINPGLQKVLAKQEVELRNKSDIAVVAGYQWHVLNKSENWITRGVRTEYAGSYVVERPGQEIMGALKIIHGSVYCIRADVMKHFGWGTSITEDYELTLRIYEKGFRVVFTPYIQAPSECVSTLKRLIRQRMRWAEGHSYNTKKMFRRLFASPHMTLMEKLEFLYLAPYYLQAAFFIVGTFSWLISETIFKVHLPFWTSVWGWSLVLTNFFAMPLVNSVGLFLEESEEKDYLGILSFVALCYLVVPFQAYAAVKGFIEPQEGTWFRTPKTGRITDVISRGRFIRWLTGILPGRKAATAEVMARDYSPEVSQYLALATAHSTFNGFRVSRRQARWIGKTFLTVLLTISTILLSLAPGVPYFIKQAEAQGFGLVATPVPAPQTNGQGFPKEVMLNVLNTPGGVPSYSGDAGAIVSVKLTKRHFMANEDIRLVLEGIKAEDTSITVIDEWGKDMPMAQEEEIIEGKTYVKINPPSSLRPGRYRVKVTDKQGETAVYDFTWGVLAINMNKSIYLPDEEVYFQMAALKDDGHTICDANLELEVTLPNGSIVKPEVKKSGSCGADNVTDKPDYFAYYKAAKEGEYRLKLTNKANGYSIEDKFVVQKSVSFDIERIGPTRIYPLAKYKMEIKIRANEKFKGSIKEVLPKSFGVEGGGFEVEVGKGDTNTIAWLVDWKAGEEHSFTYIFDAPDISPELFLLGPLTLASSGERLAFREARPASDVIFSEARRWQIASDAFLTKGMAAYQLYSQPTAPEIQSWTGSAWNSSQDGKSVVGTVQWVVVKANPQRDEIVVGTLDSAADVKVQMCTYAGVCNSVTTMTTTAGTTVVRPFDIEIEKSSGDVVVVYSEDVTQRVSWNRYNGSWVGASTFPIGTASITNRGWIELYGAYDSTSPNPDNMMLAVETTASSTYPDLYVAPWTGSTNSFGSVRTANTGIEPLNGIGYAGAFEDSSGDFILFHSRQDLAVIQWQQYSAGVWTSGSGRTSAAAAIMNFKAAVYPDTDRVMTCWNVDTTTDDLDCQEWDGSTMKTGVAVNASIEALVQPTRAIDVAPVLGTGGFVVMNPASNQDYWTFSHCTSLANCQAGTWTARTPDTTVIGTDTRWGQLYADPAGNGSIVWMGISQTTANGWIKGRITFTASGASANELANSVGAPSALVYESASFDYITYDPTKAPINQAAYRWFENYNGTSVTTPMAALNTSTTAPAQGTAFRLRTLLDVSSVNLGATAQSFELQYAAKSGDCDTDFVGETYLDVGSTSPISFYDNSTPNDGDTVTENATYDPTYLSHTKVMERYEENNPTNNVAAVPAGQAGLWDFSLVDNSAPGGTSYCLRTKRQDSSYTINPQTVKDVSSLGTTGSLNYGTWDGTSYWIGNYNDHTLHKISPAGTILNTYTLASDILPLELAWDGTYIWVASADTYGKLVKFDPSTGQTVATYTKNPTNLGLGGIQGVMYDGTNLWIGVAQNGGGAGSGFVAKLDPADPLPNGCTAPGITDVNGLTHYGSYVWAAANTGGNFVAKIAKSNCAKTTYSAGTNTVRLDNDGTYVYAANWENGGVGKVWKFLMSDGTTAPGTPYTTCTAANTIRLGTDNTYFWTACDDGKIAVHNASTGALVAELIPGTSGDNMNGLTFDGSYMWAVNWDTSHVYKMNTGEMLNTYTQIPEIKTRVKFSGYAYDDEGADPIDGSSINKTVQLRINGSGSYSDEIITSDGAWEIGGLNVNSGDIVTVYLDNETEEATTVFVSDGTAKTDINLYKNRVIVRAETGSITNANLSTGDDTDDDVKYNVATSNLTVDSGFELHVWTGDTFAPGGNVTTQGSAGHFHLDDSATFTGGTTQDHSISGNVDIDTSAVLTAPSTLDDGTFSVGGNWTKTGTFTAGSGKVLFIGAGGTTQVITGDTSFYDLTATTTTERALRFTASSTQTVTHALVFNGVSSQKLILTTSASPTKWNINASGTHAISYVHVGYSNATTALEACYSTEDASSNTNWTINASSCPTDSTSASATAQSFQRKTWYDGTRHWMAFHSGTAIEFWYSLDEGTNWVKNPLALISVSTNDFSIEADSSNAFITYTDGINIMVRKASSYPNINFSWGSATTALQGGSGWWNTSWPYRFKYTITNTGVGETLSNFPLHIDLTNDAPASFWTNVYSATGDDIRIIDEDGSTDLSSQAHLEGFAKASSRGHIWVKRTIAAAGDTEYVWIYYGNSGASSPFSDTTKQNTYDTNYKAVWHLDESTGTHYDATSNNNDSTAITVTQQGANIGKADGADEFNGTTDKVTVADSTSLGLGVTSQITLEAWYRADVIPSGGAQKGLVIKTRWTTGGRAYNLFIEGWDTYILLVFELSDTGNDPTTQVKTTVSNPMYATTWYHVVGTFNGTDMKIYIDGVEVGTSSAFSGKKINSYATPLYLSSVDTGTSWYLDGIIDEARVSSIGRSLEWVEFSKLSDQGDAGTAGTQETPSGEYDYPTISRDANNKLWITAVNYNNPDYVFKAIGATSANDIVSFSTISTLDTSTSANKYGTLVPVGVAASANMYAVWIDGTTVEGKKWSGVGTTGWAGSPDSIGTGATGMSNNLSLTADSSGNGHLSYVGVGGSAVYQEYTTAWQTAVTLDGTAGCVYTSITFDSTASTLYAFWIRGNHVYYRVGSSPYASANWVAAVDWQNPGTTITNLNSNYSGASNIFAQWLSGSISPYTVNWAKVSMGDTTSSAATGYSFQRKTWWDGNRYWQSYYSGTQIVFKYSADGTSWTTNSSATLSISTNDYTVEADSTNVFVAYVDGYSIKTVTAGSGQNYPGTGFSWTAATTPYSGSGDTDEFDYPALARDSSSNLWLTVTHHSSTNYIFKAIGGTTPNNISAWGVASSLDTSTNANKYGVIAKQSSGGNLYAVWIDDATIEGKQYTGTWAGSPTTIATGITGLAHNMSILADSNYNLHMAYINSGNSAVYQEYTSSWQTAVTLDATTGCDYASIALDTDTNNVYAVWVRSNHIYYRKGASPYTSGSWDAAVDWKNPGVNVYYVTTNYSGATRIFAEWASGNSSPYTINWDLILIPERVWMFIGAGLILPILARRKLKQNSRKVKTKKSVFRFMKEKRGDT